MSPTPKTNAAAPRRRRSTPAAAGAGDMSAAFMPTPKDEDVVNTSFNFPREWHRHLKTVAVQEGKTMRDVIMEAVDEKHPQS